MSESASLGRLELMDELLRLTREMVEKQSDSDFLIRAVEQREALMNEYDKIQAGAPPLSTDELQEVKRMAREIVGLDNAISASLEGHRMQTKTRIASNTTKQRVLGYQSGTPSSGSFLDVKK